MKDWAKVFKKTFAISTKLQVEAHGYWIGISKLFYCQANSRRH